MSISPTATRLMRWQGRHRVLADSVLAALVLGLDVLLGVVPVLSEGMSSAASWLPITTTAIILSTATLCLRRTRPATAWAVGVVVPATILGRPRQATAQARAGPVDAPPTP